MRFTVGLLAGAALAALAVSSALAAAAPRGGADIAIDGARVFPESLTSSKDGTVFFGSMGSGGVYRAGPGETTAKLWISKEAGQFETGLGVLADDRTRTLWACSTALAPPGGAVAPGAQTTVKAFDLATGKLKTNYPFPNGGQGFCNDMALDAKGGLYVADTTNGRVLLLKKGGAALEVWVTDPLLGTADGIAVLGDGAVYVNGVRTNVLVKVPVKADGSAGTPVKLTTSRELTGPDGMRAVGPDKMLVVEGSAGRLTEVTIKGDNAEIRTIRENLPTPTAVTLDRGIAYVTEAKLGLRAKPEDPGVFHAIAVPYK